MGADTSDSSGGCDALKRGHSAPLEPLAELCDALGGVGAVTITIEAAELIPGQTAKQRRSVNGRCDTKANTIGRRRTRGWRS